MYGLYNEKIRKGGCCLPVPRKTVEYENKPLLSPQRTYQNLMTKEVKGSIRTSPDESYGENKRILFMHGNNHPRQFPPSTLFTSLYLYKVPLPLPYDVNAIVKDRPVHNMIGHMHEFTRSR